MNLWILRCGSRPGWRRGSRCSRAASMIRIFLPAGGAGDKSMRCLISRYIGAPINQVAEVVRRGLWRPSHPSCRAPCTLHRTHVAGAMRFAVAGFAIHSDRSVEEKRNRNASHNSTRRPRSAAVMPSSHRYIDSCCL